jgi:hypothetical protein
LSGKEGVHGQELSSLVLESGKCHDRDWELGRFQGAQRVFLYAFGQKNHPLPLIQLRHRLAAVVLFEP